MKMNYLYIIIIVFAILIILNISRVNKVIDNFQNYNLYNAEIIGLGNNNNNQAIDSESTVLLKNSYPSTGRNSISNNSANDIWWHYPIFKVGSYDQITNNIRYPNNPDEGTCMPASMCGALYKEKQLKSNYVKPLPPINPECGTRVGYFTTDINLLPYRNNMSNILY